MAPCCAISVNQSRIVCCARGGAGVGACPDAAARPGAGAGAGGGCCNAMLDDADIFASPFLAFLLRDRDGDVGTSSERNVGSCATLTYVVINVNIEISLNEYLQYLTSLYQIACTCQHK